MYRPFAGPGGLSLGLIRAGFQILAAVERDADAGRTYRHNIGSYTHIEDLTKFSPRTLMQRLQEEGKLTPNEDLDLIAGGPHARVFR